jgi:hypothetical protein
MSIDRLEYFGDRRLEIIFNEKDASLAYFIKKYDTGTNII